MNNLQYIWTVSHISYGNLVFNNINKYKTIVTGQIEVLNKEPYQYTNQKNKGKKK